MNLLTIVGNLTADPESRQVSGGKTVCNFGVAVNRRRKVDGQPDADFFRVAAWGGIGESCQKYLSKGRKVCVIGSVSVHTYQGNDGTTKASLEVLASDVEFLSPRGDGQSQPAQSGPTDVTDAVKEELPF